jgi:hypothetical protein
MKRAVITAVAVLALLAFGCESTENEITGTFGNEQLTGKITPTGDLTGSSPAGIEVSVRETGVRTIADASGRFAFVGVPEDGVELHFTRQDGVDATFRVSAGERSVDILLSKKSSRRGRGVRNPERQIEGIIQEASESSIKVLTGNGTEHQIALTETTTIRAGNRTLTAADLVVGARVHVKALTTADGSLAAREIHVQGPKEDDDDDDNGGIVATANGIVQSVGADSLVVKTADGREITVQVDANTLIKRKGRPIPLSDIVAGDRVESLGTRVDATTILAKKIETQAKK